MANSRGRDAAEITPKFVPDYELLGRDDSGGLGFDPYTAQFGDGGRVTGAKAHLSAKGGTDDRKVGSEQDQHSSEKEGGRKRD